MEPILALIVLVGCLVLMGGAIYSALRRVERRCSIMEKDLDILTKRKRFVDNLQDYERRIR